MYKYCSGAQFKQATNLTRIHISYCEHPKFPTRNPRYVEALLSADTLPNPHNLHTLRLQ